MVGKRNIENAEIADEGEYLTPKASVVAFILSLILVVTIGNIA